MSLIRAALKEEVGGAVIMGVLSIDSFRFKLERCHNVRDLDALHNLMIKKISVKERQPFENLLSKREEALLKIVDMEMNYL